MLDVNDDVLLVARAVRALVDWHRADYTRCSYHGLARGGMGSVCPECAMIDRSAGGAFRRVQDTARELDEALVELV